MIPLHAKYQEREFNHQVKPPEFRQYCMWRWKLLESRQADKVHYGFEREDTSNQMYVVSYLQWICCGNEEEEGKIKKQIDDGVEQPEIIC